MRSIALSILLFSTCLAGYVRGQEQAEEPGADAVAAAELQERFAAFETMLEKTVFVGNFTVDGDEQQNRKPERYEISRVIKLEKGDYWTFFARITYGDHDVTVPVPVEIKWAGSTPVITVDNLTIPGMGTFDARVVIADKKYAGTWRHGKVGGLMFGRIEKQPTADEVEPSEKDTGDAE